MTAPLLAAPAYARLPVADIAAAGRFARDILGLPPGPALDGIACFRASQRQHDLSFTGPEGIAALGVELRDEAALEAAEAALGAAGFAHRRAGAEECRRRLADAVLLTADRSGNAVDLVLRPHYGGRRCHLLRDTGILGLHSVGLRSTDPAGDLAFWQALGAGVSDHVGDIAYLRIDGRHHRIALHPARRPGLLNVAFAVEGLDHVMQASYFAAEHQVRVLHGPGRQAVSGLVFLHLAGPEGHIVSLVAGDDEIGPGPRRPRRFPFRADTLCTWGSLCTEVPEWQAEAGR
ncbi:VOC family protein [Zavarzinia compransoris]|uniref:VOC family protein n=1 Tax=Zavarzinia compransoris TaxID=1264899 RepID=UPI0010D3F99C|nr:VOC family protein [Zavarzinia compransoris]TDP43993.1 2,3-dihydroxy-p-cumate/2,3-dihydroxybenzoate 3,4-dioxygenase [Zavarzinia compransoris]